jgi:hypothetical protein
VFAGKDVVSLTPRIEHHVHILLVDIEIDTSLAVLLPN